MRAVAVFDVDLPPGVAFLRSLGRAGVPVRAFTGEARAAGRASRYGRHTSWCPSVRDADEFIGWLADELAAGNIDLVAPTSDFVAFCVASAVEKVGVGAGTIGHPEPDAVRSCLFKHHFHAAMADAGFPAPAAGSPASLDEALQLAERLSYPVVMKPRSHAGVGFARGIVARSAAELAASFGRFPMTAGQDSVLAHDADVDVPMIQRYHQLGTFDIVSISGYLGRDGGVQALTHARKVSQSPRRLGVGTMFEPVGAQPWTEAAITAVQQVLGTGLFELEVLVEHGSGHAMPLDLNPRGFGQMSLDIALGRDLPVLWYNDVTGSNRPTARAAQRPPQFWHDALSSYTGMAVGVLRGPRRTHTARDAFRHIAAPAVGAMHEWRDPLPGIRFALARLLHPRSFVRPFLTDVEIADGPDSLGRRSEVRPGEPG